MFRLHAAVDVDAAVAKWGSEAFRQKWEAEVNALFSRQERFELHDFFSGAVVWVGGAAGTRFTEDGSPIGTRPPQFHRDTHAPSEAED